MDKICQDNKFNTIIMKNMVNIKIKIKFNAVNVIKYNFT